MLLGTLLASQEQKPGGKKAISPLSKKSSNCPLCGSKLERGERVHSVAYRGRDEKLVHIFGCPFCYSSAENAGKSSLLKITRRCPACRKELPPDGYAVGKMWDREGKTHLHVIGCTECKPLARL